MGTMTLSEFRDEVKLALDNRGDAAVNDTRMNRFINAAYLHMTHPSVFPFPNQKTSFDIALATDDFDYSIASGATIVGGTLDYRVLAFRSVSYLAAASASITATTRRRVLHPRDVQWYDNRTHSSAEPRYFVADEEEQILVSPTPTSSENGNTLRCRVWREVARLTADGDTTTVDDYFDEVLVLGAQTIAEFRLGYRDRARETLELYTGLINDVRPKEDLEAGLWGYRKELLGSSAMRVSQ